MSLSCIRRRSRYHSFSLREPLQQLSSLTTRAEELSSYCVRQPVAWQSSRSTMGNLALYSAEEPDNLRATTGTVEVPTERDNDAALVLGARPIIQHQPAARHRSKKARDMREVGSVKTARTREFRISWSRLSWESTRL